MSKFQPKGKVDKGGGKTENGERAIEGEAETRMSKDDGSVRLSEGVRMTVPLRETKTGGKQAV
jgi:hypothetical protein